MVLSKVYSNTFAGQRVKAEHSSFLTVNPHAEVGSILFAGSCAERAALGGQVAAKLSLQHFVGGAEQALNGADSLQPATELSLTALEAAFRTANSAVYEFGHKLSAGGRMAASVISVFIREGVIAAGRVGHGVAYLARQGEIFPFFAAQPPGHECAFVGSNSLVSVELASVPAEPGDIIVIFSEPPATPYEEELGYSISLLLPRFDQIDTESDLHSTIQPRIMDRFDSKACERLAHQIFGEKGPGFASVLALGPDVFFLDEVEQAQSESIEDSWRPPVL